MLETLLQAALDAPAPVLLISIVRASGSTPRKTGALMLAGTDGLLAGTIGGGLLEHRCLERAAQHPDAPHRETFVLDNRQAGAFGMVCGGTAEVLFTPLRDRALLARALAAARADAPLRLCLPLDGGAPLLAPAEGLSDRPAVQTVRGRDALVLPLREGGRVYLIGGGHVSLALSTLLHQLGTRHLVADDREAFCSPARFPHAAHTIVTPLSALADAFTDALAPTASDAICIMTRGHAGDTDAVRYALTTPAGYIGVMGSRRKREGMLAQLEQEGFADARERIISPIGLSIGAQTPAEIAVSIAAQLIAWRQENFLEKS